MLNQVTADGLYSHNFINHLDHFFSEKKFALINYPNQTFSLPGQFPTSIKVGVVVSVFSLAWGSSRAFFIERTRDEADPDPALPMVVMWVLPCMLLIALNSMMMWTLTGGILGKAYSYKLICLTFQTCDFRPLGVPRHDLPFHRECSCGHACCQGVL